MATTETLVVFGSQGLFDFSARGWRIHVRVIVDAGVQCLQSPSPLQNTAAGNRSQEPHQSPPPILAVRIGHVPLNEPRTARPRSYASREAGIVLRTLCEAIVGPCGPSGSDQRSLAGLPGKRRLQ